MTPAKSAALAPPHAATLSSDFVQIVQIVGSFSARMASNPRERGLFRLLD